MDKIMRILTFTLICFYFLFCISCSMLPEKKVELQHLKSPNKEKEAVLEISESGSVYLITKIGEKVIDKGFSIYSGENMFGDKHRDFVEICPTRKWLNDRVLFLGFENYNQSQKALIYIKNSSSKTIDQLEVDPCGKYIVYEIQPDEIVSIPVEMPNNDTLRCDVSVEGLFTEGTRIPLSSNYFDEPKSEESEKQHCGNVDIVVTNEKVLFRNLINN